MNLWRSGLIVFLPLSLCFASQDNNNKLNYEKKATAFLFQQNQGIRGGGKNEKKKKVSLMRGARLRV